MQILFSHEDFKSVQAVEKMLSELLDESPFFDPKASALDAHQRGQLEDAVNGAHSAMLRLRLLLTGDRNQFVEPIDVDALERERAHAGRRDDA